MICNTRQNMFPMFKYCKCFYTIHTILVNHNLCSHFISLSERVQNNPSPRQEDLLTLKSVFPRMHIAELLLNVFYRFVLRTAVVSFVELFSSAFSLNYYLMNPNKRNFVANL